MAMKTDPQKGSALWICITGCGKKFWMQFNGKTWGWLFPVNDKRDTISKVQKVVANHYRVKLKDLKGPARYRAIVVPRQMAMYLCKTLFGECISVRNISLSFGGRHHSTVMHAVRRIRKLVEDDPKVARDFGELNEVLGGV